MKNKQLLMAAVAFVLSSMPLVTLTSENDSLASKIVEAIDTRPKTSAAALLLTFLGEPILGSLFFGHAYYKTHQGTKNLNFHLIAGAGLVGAAYKMYQWYTAKKDKPVEQPVRPVEEGPNSVELQIQISHG